MQAKTKLNFALAGITSRPRKRRILICSKYASIIGFLIVKKELGLAINMEVEKKIGTWFGFQYGGGKENMEGSDLQIK